LAYLLDVNVLIALIDPAHVAHDTAHGWFATTGAAGFATCPITECGVLRILGHPKYPNSLGSPAAVAPLLVRLRTLPGHHFWPDDLSPVAGAPLDAERIATPGQVTDSYLLALAIAHGGRLATLDRRLSLRAVRGGRAALHLIEDAA
jgi:toxin-antitoxin system PIN domain toxin